MQTQASRAIAAARTALAALAFVSCGLLLTHSTLAAKPLPETDSTKLQQSFVWLNSAPAGTQVYAVFRKEFELASAPKAGVLNLFADSRYTVWVNGRHVERGPCRFDPIAPQYDALDLAPFLNAGSNAIAVLVHHYHDGKSATNYSTVNGRIMRHPPGLTAQLDLDLPNGKKLTLRTDETWRGSTQTRFLPSPTDRWENTWSSIPDRIDARRDTGDWTRAGFDDSTWEKPIAIDSSQWGPLRPRGIPRLRESEAGPLVLVGHLQADTNRFTSNHAPIALKSVLPLALQPGDQLVIDAGEFTQAYSLLDFDAAEGTELELEYAGRYSASRQKPSGGMGRVNRYTSRAGRQTYMSGDTFGFQFLVVRLKSGQATLHDAKIISRLYPFDVAGSFQSNDAMLNQLWSNCVHTVRVCSEDAYVDCAVRERAEWMADGYAVAYRTTRVAFTGPAEGGVPRFSDPRLLRSLLRNIAQSLQPDGRLKAHHPSDRWDIHGYIEDYSCLWVQALREYHDHTGDLEVARELWPALTAQLQWFLDRRTTNGLVKGREFVYFGNPLLYKTCEGATLNAFVYGALTDAAFLAERLGKPEQSSRYATAAADIRHAVNTHLWTSDPGTYFGSLTDGKPTPPTAHAAMSCLHFNLVPPEREAATRRWLLENYRKEGFVYPYTYQYLLAEIYRADTPETDREALDLIRERWAGMARCETRTVWEAIGPSEICHEAGAVPAYFLSAYVLGVRLDGPASARRLLIQPRLADLKNAAGTVVTELGLVRVNWQRESPESPLDFEIEIPAHTRATLSLPVRGRNPALTLNGQIPDGQHISKGRLICEIGPGLHRGQLAEKTRPTED